jgi:3,4-dihydroxy 2-butanone 4-phosphate synthase / GTP cyclohydrolase II
VLPLPIMEQDSCSTIMTPFGKFKMLGFINEAKDLTVISLIKGSLNSNDYPLVRVHSKCATSEVFGSFLCDCAEQILLAMDRIQAEDNGLIIYLPRQEARGNGLKAKLRIYQAMEIEHLTSSQACEKLGYPIDIRSYIEAAAVLNNLGIRKMRLLTNSPTKVEAFLQLGFDIHRETLFIKPNQYNLRYLLDKEENHGHDLGLRKNLGGANG